MGFFAVHGPLAVVAFPVAEHRLRTRRLSGHGSRAQPLRGMWDLPGPGHEPVTPASAGRLTTTGPPGKPSMSRFYTYLTNCYSTTCRGKIKCFLIFGSPLLIAPLPNSKRSNQVYSLMLPLYLIIHIYLQFFTTCCSCVCTYLPYKLLTFFKVGT